MEFLSSTNQSSLLIGNKSYNLSKLIKLGIPVKEGIVLTIEEVKNIYNGKFDIKGFDHAMNNLCGKVFAIRSSTTVEDSNELSWAGQFTTVLNVIKENILSELKMQIEKDLQYSANNIYSNKGLIYPSILIQEMVIASYSGVIFTMNPVTLKNEYVVEFQSGLSEELVSGRISPFRFQFNNEDYSFKSEPVDCLKLIGNNGMFNIINTSAKIKKIFKSDQDIEWAIEENTNKLFINQSRPITTYGKSNDLLLIHNYSRIVLGTGVAHGIVNGTVLRVDDIESLYLNPDKVKENTIVITNILSPKSILLFKLIKSKKGGIIAEEGGVLSHGAIVAREMGLTAIVGVKDEMNHFKDGMNICMNGYTGEIFIQSE